ncbi:MAG: hypothetical protein C4307_05670, partial [Chloroflexota bacterium]
MKHKGMLATLVAAALAVPTALAAPPLGKGKPPATGPGCKPKVTVVLKGTLTTDPGVGATSFGLQVTGASRHGQSLVTSPPATVTIAVGADTKVRRNGAKTIDALAQGDRTVVHLRLCKADVADGISSSELGS